MSGLVDAATIQAAEVAVDAVETATEVVTDAVETVTESATDAVETATSEVIVEGEDTEFNTEGSEFSEWDTVVSGNVNEVDGDV